MFKDKLKSIAKIISLALVLVTVFTAFTPVSFATSNSNSYCTIIYNANGGSGAPAAQKVVKGKDFYISSKIPKRSGYSFLGWGNKGDREARISPRHYLHTNANYTLYAVWAKGEVKTNYAYPLTNGYCYYISPACASSSVFDVNDWGTSANTNIQIWQKEFQKNQRFQAVRFGNYYAFVDYNSHLALDVHGGIALNCQNISTWHADFNDAQLFRLVSAGNGYYYIQSKLNPAYYLDIEKGSSSNGANVILYRFNNGSSNQKFKFTPVYNVSAAVNYAKKYTDNSGAMEGYYNETYNIYKKNNPPAYKGYDCANFISQCLYAGGINATQSWAPVYRGQNYKKISGGLTWVSATNLFPYLKSQGFAYEKVRNNLNNIYRGDIVFLDFDNDGKADHSTICTGFSNNTPVFCAHSNWRKNYPYSTSMWSGGCAYVVHMSGQGT